MAPRVNLVLQIVMALALLLCMFLARRRQYRAHGICQSAVMLVNLVLIARIMLPSFVRQVGAEFSVAFAHAVAGCVAELLGLYGVLVAGTNLIPAALRFKNYKVWMRTTLILWCVTLLGVGTYAQWYTGAPGSPAPCPPRPPTASR